METPDFYGVESDVELVRGNWGVGVGRGVVMGGEEGGERGGGRWGG